MVLNTDNNFVYTVLASFTEDKFYVN